MPKEVKAKKMKKSVKKLWLKALRSGEYKQGRNACRQEESRGDYKYCCLGVLCDLYKKTQHDSTPFKRLTFGESNMFPGKKVYAWAKFPKNVDTHLVLMNDNGAGFEKIADYIEAEL